jgi:hypothetical protein
MAGMATKLCIGGLTVLAGCQTMANGDDMPARIANPTEASRAELQRVVNELLGTTVMIADDALTGSSTLSIERKAPANPQGRLATGRNMEPPIQFRLVLNDSACILIDTRDGSRHSLASTTCIAL